MKKNSIVEKIKLQKLIERRRGGGVLMLLANYEICQKLHFQTHKQTLHSHLKERKLHHLIKTKHFYGT